MKPFSPPYPPPLYHTYCRKCKVYVLGSKMRDCEKCSLTPELLDPAKLPLYLIYNLGSSFPEEDLRKFLDYLEKEFP